MIKHDFTLHAGHDFNFTYQVPEDSDLNLTGYTGVCKIRKRPNEAVVFELNATIEEKERYILTRWRCISEKNSYRLKTLYMTLLFIMRVIISS